jgi:hypothetical protein
VTDRPTDARIGRLVQRLDARGPQRREVADGAPDKFTKSGPDSVDKFVRDELVAMFFPLVTGERYGRRSGRTGPLSGTPGLVEASIP